MTVDSVHWNEGMFLCPQHMQLADRLNHRQVYLSHRWNLHYSWGLRALDLDAKALADGRFVVRSLKARLRDGTLIAVPEEGVLPGLELKEALDAASTVTIFLAVPQLQMGKRNALEPPRDFADEDDAPPPPEAAEPDAADDQEPTDPRYLVDAQEVEDENSGDNPQRVLVRLLNLKLLLSTQAHAGYDVLPLGRVLKSASADAVPELDRTYIPPVLACEAWQALHAGIIQNVYDRIGKKIELLAGQVLGRSISFDTRLPGGPARLGQLHALNEAYALLAVLAFAEGIHPLLAYLELCRLVGQLAIFGTERRVQTLPHYDHDDLAGCFGRIKIYLDALLDEVEEPSYEERPFIGEGLRIQVELKPEWLAAVWQMYIGVHSPLGAEECIRLLTRPGQLDMKIGSAPRVDEIFDRGEAGLKFAHSPLPPQSLPVETGLIFFQIKRESQQAEWQNVQRALALAIRLNQNLVVGNIQGQRRLTIKNGGQNITMQFTLYLVPQES